jgi:hypothetical protein
LNHLTVPVAMFCFSFDICGVSEKSSFTSLPLAPAIPSESFGP